MQPLAKLDEVRGLTTITLDKLSAIRGDLVKSDDDWENWDLDKLAEAFGFDEILLVLVVMKNKPISKCRDCERMFLTNKGDKPRGCVYCESNEHKRVDCNKVTTSAERTQILAQKKLCFNCAIGTHVAAKCQSKSSCQKCHKRHHTSICDKSDLDETKKVALTPSSVGEGVFPVVLLKVDGIITRALIDTGPPRWEICLTRNPAKP